MERSDWDASLNLNNFFFFFLLYFYFYEIIMQSKEISSFILMKIIRNTYIVGNHIKMY